MTPVFNQMVLGKNKSETSFLSFCEFAQLFSSQFEMNHVIQQATKGF